MLVDVMKLWLVRREREKNFQSPEVFFGAFGGGVTMLIAFTCTYR